MNMITPGCGRPSSDSNRWVGQMPSSVRTSIVSCVMWEQRPPAAGVPCGDVRGGARRQPCAPPCPPPEPCDDPEPPELLEPDEPYPFLSFFESDTLVLDVLPLPPEPAEKPLRSSACPLPLSFGSFVRAMCVPRW